MNYTTRDQFKADFKFPVRTDSYKFNDAEFKTLLDQAYELYGQPGLNFNKVGVSAGNFESAVEAIIELSKEGYSYPKKRKPNQSGPSYAFYLVKPQTLQNEDRDFIKDLVMSDYLSVIEQNEKAYKVRLKQQMIDAERQKESDKAAKAAADKEAKLQAEADKQFEQLLKQEGVA